MRTFALLSALVLAPAAAPAAPAPEAAPIDVEARAAAAAQDTFRWRAPLAAGKALEVKGVIGDVRAEPASGGVAEVIAVKSAGRRGEPEDVEIEVVEDEDGITVCAVYPTPVYRSRSGRERAAEANVCAPGDGGRMSTNDIDTRVDFIVRVPAGVSFHGRSVTGDVVARGLRADTDVASVSGSVEATGIGGNARGNSVSGDVRLAAAGHAEGQSVSGDIDVVMGRTDWSSKVDFQTVSGSITIVLPADASTDVDARTMSGRITSDFALQSEERRSMHRRMSGTVGRGGRSLHVETLSGSIRLERR